MIKEFSIENVRCFKGKQTVSIRPVTFLIGENSTGKTTLLGCLQALLDVVSRPHFMREGMDFNNPPYDMGTFVDIVRRGTPTLNAFQLGLQLEMDKSETDRARTIFQTFHFIENQEGTEPILNAMGAEFLDTGLGDGGKMILKPYKKSKTKKHTHIDIDQPLNIKKENNVFILYLNPILFERGYIFDLIPDYLPFYGVRTQESASSSDTEDFLSFIAPLKKNLRRELLYSKMYSFAPVRSKPKRVYVPIKETEDPEGSHIYMYLNNIYQTERWTGLQEKINDFGKQSGMFDNIDVKRLGEHKTDPFQIQTTIHGQKNNILDVGYGVSQILPVLATILRSKDEIGTFAIQQPEVHLHPKAQAALSSLLVNIAKEQKKSFIIETHSDAMIDRARVEVMNGTIAAEDVSIVYLEPKDGEVKIHNITMDDQGNLEHAPQGYRDFFTKETDDLLGWS